MIELESMYSFSLKGLFYCPCNISCGVMVVSLITLISLNLKGPRKNPSLVLCCGKDAFVQQTMINEGKGACLLFMLLLLRFFIYITWEH